jgi:two-component system, LytTR family, sensor kinase
LIFAKGNESTVKLINVSIYQLSAGWSIFLAIDTLKKTLWTASSDYIFLFYFPGFLMWLPFSYLLIRIFNLSMHLALIQRLITLLMAGAIVGIIKNIIAVKLFFWLGGSNLNAPMIRLNVPFFYVEAAIIAWIVLIIFFLVEFYKSYQFQSVKSAQLESRLAQAQLQALKMQLQPHFLFNTHNSIATLIRSGKNKQALKMLLGLSDLLRISLSRPAEQMITLKEELDLLGRYLDIEVERFEEELKIEYHIEDSAKNALVPNFILQPLIENAIKHGVSKSIGDSIIRIGANLENEHLIIKIYNSSPALGEDWRMNDQKGIGLANTLNRLQQLYGKSYRCILVDHQDGILLKMEIPFKT